MNSIKHKGRACNNQEDKRIIGSDPELRAQINRLIDDACAGREQRQKRAKCKRK